jgi:hypothetical protein
MKTRQIFTLGTSNSSFLLLSLLSQLIAAAFLAIQYLHHYKILPQGSEWIIAATLLFTFYLTAGLGKWEIPSLAALMGLRSLWKDHFAFPYIILALIAFLISIAALNEGNRGRFSDLNPLGKWLYGLLTPIILVEVGLFISSAVFVIWFALAWDFSANFG